MKRVFTLLAASLLSASLFAEDEARLLRFPATNGSEVVFSYAGDLYTVPIDGGAARRLTSHIGYEMFARYSPDGKSIAFTGEYDGNREVYLIPSEGGEPKRLTFTSTNSRDDLGDRMGPNNIVMTWNPDGKSIVFRNRIGDGFPGELWTVGRDGGMAQKINLPEGGFCSWSADGKKFAYNRVMREFRTWKYYRGGMADDIWVWDQKAKKIENVTNNNAQDIFPMWIGDEIFFASDRDMIMNLFSYNTKTGQTVKVTDFDTYDVKFPSTNGRIIVFENGGYIYKFDPATRQSVKIPISLTADFVYGRTERKAVGDNYSSYSLSPDGSRLVATARGEVFDVPVGKGVVRSISRTPGSNDRSADWSPDGTKIAWIGDGTGETEIYLYDAIKGGEPKQLTKDNDTYVRSLQWSPDSKKILYTDRKNRIVEVDAATGVKKTVMQNPEQEFYGVEYSPDSKWITYTKPASNQMSVVYVYNLAEGKEYPVTDKWYDSGSAVFSSDGKYLIFTSNRDIRTSYSAVEWNFSVGYDMSGVYMAMLAEGTPSPLIEKDAQVNAKTPEKEGDKAEVTVVVDPKGLQDRVIKLPIKGRGFYCDGKKLWYMAAGGTKVFDFATKKEDSCTDGRMMYRTGDKKALFSKGGKLYAAPVGPKVKLDDNIDFSNLYANIDYAQEWAQIFDEVWRAFRDGYYVENMHGRDWKAIKEKYAVLLPYVKTRLDLNYIIGEMIGELASGHAYVNPGEYPKPARVPMGLLGAEISKDKSGYFRIDRILEGDNFREMLRSPLQEPGLGVKKGQLITAIDGIPTNTVENIYELLIGKADVLTELSIAESAKDEAKKVVIKPISDEAPIYHYEWIMKNIKTVEEKSGGKVGYIYIPDMGPEGLDQFVRYFYPQLDKEALIIDDRANGGGNISPMIIERLKREVYRMTMSRTSSLNGTIPDATHTGPKVLLINKYSASDGDLFPWSFKANNLGTVIGTRTWGGIVGISGSLPYMDGTDVRVPFFTNYDVKTGEWIVENYGVAPDIEIDNDPLREAAGEDQQLLKAIEVAMEQLKDRKPLPKTPADRTFKDLGLPQLK